MHQLKGADKEDEAYQASRTVMTRDFWETLDMRPAVQVTPTSTSMPAVCGTCVRDLPAQERIDTHTLHSIAQIAGPDRPMRIRGWKHTTPKREKGGRLEGYTCTRPAFWRY